MTGKIMTDIYETLFGKSEKVETNKQIIKRVKKNAEKFDINNSSSWHATCEECGNKKMEYFNLRYCCPDCGHILEV